MLDYCNACMDNDRDQHRHLQVDQKAAACFLGLLLTYYIYFLNHYLIHTLNRYWGQFFFQHFQK